MGKLTVIRKITRIRNLYKQLLVIVLSLSNTTVIMNSNGPICIHYDNEF